ncbi:hypothetical protein M4951_04350 [Blastopirellula sp. J2-11]|uniref:hypothetical protein n=1 Tax=Blastopirellula sp. J2-11 TaxID=2943192 RepID=UPI0021CA6720|nr:hypothetical protein [Blastopirellula sp. J2-11]UUO07543.1 hypothetical protein M4951_04350 [Blastopirellula sp. J2-11]
MKTILQIALLISPALLSLGCGPSFSDTTVKGAVRFQGESLTTGQVVIEANGRAYVAPIIDGQYNVQTPSSVPFPPGDYKVTVIPPDPKTAIDPKSGEIVIVERVDESKFPRRYRKLETSGLVVEIVAGENIFDIEMK